MKKFLLIVLVCSGVIGAFLPETETAEATPVVAKVVVELTEAEKQEKSNKLYRDNRYNECYGAMTRAHKKNGLQERNRKQAIQTREQVCTLALTDSTITGWNKIYTEIK